LQLVIVAIAINVIGEDLFEDFINIFENSLALHIIEFGERLDVGKAVRVLGKFAARKEIVIEQVLIHQFFALLPTSDQYRISDHNAFQGNIGVQTLLCYNLFGQKWNIHSCVALSGDEKVSVFILREALIPQAQCFKVYFPHLFVGIIQVFLVQARKAHSRWSFKKE